MTVTCPTCGDDGEIRGVINAEAIATEDELLRVLNSYLREGEER